MSDTLPLVYIVRHGETAWSQSGQHTGLTDLPLVDRGRRNAQRLRDRLAHISFDRVWSSPLKRAMETCALAGFGDRAEVGPDLVEWNYGDYEGKTTADIRREHPDWKLFRDGCPGGESVAQIALRADRVIERLRRFQGVTLLFSSGHITRVIAARWCGWEARAAACLFLGTASVSTLGYEHGLEQPVIRLWNDVLHVEAK